LQRVLNYSIKYKLTVTSSTGAFGRVFKGVFKTNQDEEEPEFTPVAIKTIKSEGDYSVHVRTKWLGMKNNCQHDKGTDRTTTCTRKLYY